MINNKKLNYGIININITNNNYLINITDLLGNTICWESAGTSSFKGSKKKAPFVIQTVINNILKKANEIKLKKAEINIKGEGINRFLALQTLSNGPLEIISITDKNRIPHNGCRPPKKRKI